MAENANTKPAITAGVGGPKERVLPNPKLRLREQFHEVCRFKRLAERTEEAYWGWVRRRCRPRPAAAGGARRRGCGWCPHARTQPRSVKSPLDD